jgi:hypothetical protein
LSMQIQDLLPDMIIAGAINDYWKKLFCVSIVC